MTFTPTLSKLALSAVAVTVATGCSTISPPFNTMKGSQMTIYRLNNNPQPAAASPSPMGGMQLPPQIQQWITAGASLLPPGLLPPGLLPGTAAPPVAANTQRFPPEAGANGFPILGWQPVTDSGLQGQILDLLGHQSNFMTPPQQCMYAEFGISISRPNSPQPANMLVSLSCQQVQATDFQWPYPANGLTPDTEKKFVAIAQQVFTGQH
jgi:hypothetical protein